MDIDSSSLLDDDDDDDDYEIVVDCFSISIVVIRMGGIFISKIGVSLL